MSNQLRLIPPDVEPLKVPPVSELEKPGGVVSVLFLLLRAVLQEASSEIESDGRVGLGTLNKVKILGKEIRESDDLKKIKEQVEKIKILTAELLARKGGVPMEDMLPIVEDMIKRLA